MSSVLVSLFRWVLWPTLRSVLLNIPYELGKNWSSSRYWMRWPADVHIGELIGGAVEFHCVLTESLPLGLPMCEGGGGVEKSPAVSGLL